MVLNKFLLVIQILSLTIFICCGPTKKDNSESTDKALDAFSKIDSRSEDLFTKDDRVAAFKNSIKSSENQIKSLNTKSTYNGYGTQNKTLKEKTKNNSAPAQKNKKVNYYLKKGGGTQTYSAYSTN